VAAGKFSHIAVDDVEAAGKDDIDPDEHEDCLDISIDYAQVGEAKDDRKTQDRQEWGGSTLHKRLLALDFGCTGNAEDAGGFLV
jgi:hypothetical protein